MSIFPGLGDAEKLVERMEAVAESMADSAYRTEQAAQTMQAAADMKAAAAEKMERAARTMPTHITHDRH